MITRGDLHDLRSAAALAGVEVDAAKLDLVVWNAGDGHVPTQLRSGYAAVYVFVWNRQCLKVGKVNQKSRPRYHYQHYKPKSCRSNLALSLLGNAEFCESIGDDDVGEWIRRNTTRYNILIPVEFGEEFVHFAEAFFILKCRPRFEGG